MHRKADAGPTRQSPGLWASTLLSPLWWDDFLSEWRTMRFALPLVRVLGVVIVVLLGAIGVLLWQYGAPQARGPSPSPPVPRILATVPVITPASQPPATPPASIRTIAPVSGAGPTLPASPTASPPPQTIRATPATPPASPQTSGDIQQRASESEAALRSGVFEITIVYSQTTKSVIHLEFDLGATPETARLYTRSSYTGMTGTRNEERVQIGKRAWQRQPTAQWVAGPAAEGVADQLRRYLPQVAQAVAPVITTTDNQQILSWHDVARDADLILIVDMASGQPRRLVQQGRSSGATMTVIYTAWNGPVSIPTVPGT